MDIAATFEVKKTFDVENGPAFTQLGGEKGSRHAPEACGERRVVEDDLPNHRWKEAGAFEWRARSALCKKVMQVTIG